MTFLELGVFVFGQFSHLADKKKVSATNAKPQPRVFWGKKWPKVTSTLFY
jgi:hypothetical protein